MYIGRKYYFLVIAETQNLTKAAQILHVSQPSLTQYVNRLEQDLGVRLLNRNHTPLLLTEAGRFGTAVSNAARALSSERKLQAFYRGSNTTDSNGLWLHHP